MKLSSNKMKLNFLFVLVIILVTFGSFLFIQKVYALQFIESDFFENQALSYRQRVEILEAKRGTIYDKNFNVLASSVQSYNVVVKSNEIDDLGFVSVLSSLLNLDEAEILKKINDNSKFFYLKRNVDYETGNKIKSWKFNGIHLEHSNKRNVYDSSSSNIVGFVDPDGNGIEGLELYYDNLLKGEEIGRDRDVTGVQTLLFRSSTRRNKNDSTKARGRFNSFN